jgi:hypothetical protein
VREDDKPNISIVTLLSISKLLRECRNYKILLMY